MRKILNVALASILMLGLLACEARTDRTDGGGVLLTFGQIDWAAVYSVSAAVANGGATIDTVTLVSVTKDPNGVTSSLMDVELQSFEVSFRRADTGTRLPPVLVRTFPGIIPVNGTLTISGMFFLLDGQLENPPLSDLLAVNGGVDGETGAESILLDVSIVFFGRTLSGDEVQSAPLRKTVQFGR
jgi:hypothetical protein